MAKYIDNKRFEVLILEYTGGDKKNEEELMLMFYTLIDKIISGFTFSVDKDNASQECMLLIIKTLNTFDPLRGSAFNFFTTLIINSLKRLYTKNKKYKQKIDAYTDHIIHKLDS
jgi:DNA-directed RNA polymerase specialized sigma subunit